MQIKTCYHVLTLVIISASVKPAQLTTALVVLLVVSTESAVLLLMFHRDLCCNLGLGLGTGLTSTSNWLPSVTGG